MQDSTDFPGKPITLIAENNLNRSVAISLNLSGSNVLHFSVPSGSVEDTISGPFEIPCQGSYRTYDAEFVLQPNKTSPDWGWNSSSSQWEVVNSDPLLLITTHSISSMACGYAYKLTVPPDYVNLPMIGQPLPDSYPPNSTRQPLVNELDNGINPDSELTGIAELSISEFGESEPVVLAATIPDSDIESFTVSPQENSSRRGWTTDLPMDTERVHCFDGAASLTIYAYYDSELNAEPAIPAEDLQTAEDRLVLETCRDSGQDVCPVEIRVRPGLNLTIPTDRACLSDAPEPSRGPASNGSPDNLQVSFQIENDMDHQDSVTTLVSKPGSFGTGEWSDCPDETVEANDDLLATCVGGYPDEPYQETDFSDGGHYASIEAGWYPNDQSLDEQDSVRWEVSNPPEPHIGVRILIHPNGEMELLCSGPVDECIDDSRQRSGANTGEGASNTQVEISGWTNHFDSKATFRVGTYQDSYDTSPEESAEWDVQAKTFSREGFSRLLECSGSNPILSAGATDDDGYPTATESWNIECGSGYHLTLEGEPGESRLSLERTYRG